MPSQGKQSTTYLTVLTWMWRYAIRTLGCCASVTTSRCLAGSSSPRSIASADGPGHCQKHELPPSAISWGPPRPRAGSGLLAGHPAAGPAALLGVEYRLAQPDRRGGDLGALVVGAELERLLQAEDARRDQPLELFLVGLADVGDLLLLGDVHVHVVVTRVLADDHALIDLGGRVYEQ